MPACRVMPSLDKLLYHPHVPRALLPCTQAPTPHPLIRLTPPHPTHPTHPLPPQPPVQAVEAGLDLLGALVRDDDRLLESLCLVGAVPAVARFSQQPWPLPLRLRAAAFLHGLCFRCDTTMQVGGWRGGCIHD